MIHFHFQGLELGPCAHELRYEGLDAVFVEDLQTVHVQRGLRFPKHFSPKLAVVCWDFTLLVRL